MNSSEIFYRNVEAERARKGWTIAECAEKLGITEKTYRNRRDNKSRLSGEELVAIATAFNCSTDYLLGLSDSVRR